MHQFFFKEHERVHLTKHEHERKQIKFLRKCSEFCLIIGVRYLYFVVL